MKKSIKTILIVAAAVILIVVGVLGYNRFKERKAILAQFEGTPSTAKVSTGDVELYISVSGNIETADHVNVEANTLGKVSTINYNVGDIVETGDVLVEVSDEVLVDEIEDLEKQILDQQLTIDKTNLPNDTYYIKASVDGTAKDIQAEYGDDVKEVMDEYGYLALISLQDKMYVKVTDDLEQYTKDMEVKVYCESRRYTGVVEKVEGDAAYIVINTDSRTVGASAYVYNTDGDKLGKGYAELYDYIKVTAHSGTIKEVNTYEDESLSFNEQLFRISADPQEMVNKYDTLADLQEQLAEKQDMLESLQITAPVSGFITEMHIAEGDTIENDAMVVCKLADTSSWIATVEVDELDINDVKPGQTVNITADALPDQTFIGTVKELSSVGTSSQGITTYDVKIEVPSNPAFKSAMSVTGEILTKSAQSVINVPVEAVRTMGDKSYVVIYVDRSDEEKDAIKDTILQSNTTVTAALQGDKAITMAKNGTMDKAQIQKMKDNATATGGNRQKSNEDKAAVQKNTTTMLASAVLSPLEQLYGEICFVEVGLKNETSAEIISGLSDGEIVLLPTKESSAVDFNKAFGMPGMARMGGGGKK